MKIGVISDTHMPDTGKTLPPEVARAFAGVGLILHAGDIRNSECLDELERIAPVLAVDIAPAPVYTNKDPRVVHDRVVDVEGHAIGMTHDFQLHGHGWEIVPGTIARWITPEMSIADLVTPVFGRPVDIVVFGHTHVALLEWHQNTLFVNPGSATLPRQVRRLGSVAIIDVTPESYDAQIVQLADLREE